MRNAVKWIVGGIIAVILGFLIGTAISTPSPAQEVPSCTTVEQFRADPDVVAMKDKLTVIEIPANLVPMVKARIEERAGPAPFEWDGLLMTKNSDNEGVVMVGFLNGRCIVHVVQWPEIIAMELIKEAVEPKKEGDGI